MQKEQHIFFQVASTPAGNIIYPLFVKNGGRCLRPLTIDGQIIISDDKVEITQISCMLTPIHFGQIKFHSEKIKEDKFSNGGYLVECEVVSSGNPFESLFAMEMIGERIALYHHTTKESEKLILESGVINGSKWNIKGTNEHPDFHNIYFTNIPKIEDRHDLFEIGMAEEGTELSIITDDNVIETIEVYRENPLNRPAALKVWVDWHLISTNHLILHNQDSSHLTPTMIGTFSWWEVFTPSIFRVPVKKKTHLKHTYNKKKNEYKLNYGPNFQETNGFSAALGTDLHGLKINWVEERIPRITDKPNDYGMLDQEWVEIWNNNFTRLTNTLLENMLMKK